MINSTTFFHFHRKMFVVTFEITSRCTSSFHQILLHRPLYLNIDPLSCLHHLHTTVRLFSHKFQKTLSNLLGNNALMILYIQVFFFLFHIQCFGTLSKLLFIILLHQVEFRNSNRHHLLVYSASSLKSGFFSFLVKVANSAIISQVCVIES